MSQTSPVRPLPVLTHLNAPDQHKNGLSAGEQIAKVKD